MYLGMMVSYTMAYYNGRIMEVLGYYIIIIMIHPNYYHGSPTGNPQRRWLSTTAFDFRQDAQGGFHRGRGLAFRGVLATATALRFRRSVMVQSNGITMVEWYLEIKNVYNYGL